PTGTISLLADNVSSGIEPVFAYRYTRKITQADGSRRDEPVEDYAYKLYREKFGDEKLPAYFVNAQELTPEAHLAVQAATQKYIDSSISKTVNCPRDISFEAFKSVYTRAYELDCKGCTTWRPNEITGAILTLDDVRASAPAASPIAAPVPVPEVLPPAPI